MDLFWRSFLRHSALHSKAGSIRQLDGVEAAWVHSALPINNGAYLTSPVAGEVELRARVSSASDDARPHGLPWILYLYHPYLGSLAGESADTIASEFGLARMMEMQVMTGDVHSLKPPQRPFAELEFRRIMRREEAWTAFDINLRSYEMPLFMADSVLDTGAYFSDPQREFGFVAWAEGVPVSTATVIELEGWLYVALVATDPDHRKKGYAEAVMRHALGAAASALQVTRTALDASLMGAPLYSQMGYQHAGQTWSLYTTV